MAAAKTLKMTGARNPRVGAGEDFLYEVMDNDFLDIEEEEKMEEAIRSIPTNMSTRRSLM